MKRLFLAFVAALATGVLLAGTGTAGENKGPPCTNFVFGDGGYAYNAGDDSGTVTATMTLAAPACADTTYLLDIYELDGSPLLVNNIQGTALDQSVTFTYSFTAGSAPNDGVCLVVESIWRGHVADRAPNNGCTPFPANDFGGDSGFS